jgi:glycosyltransferase involved in cell wall biosynthesis
VDDADALAPTVGTTAMSSLDPAFRLAVYSDAPALGGAEVNLSRVLGALPDSIEVTVVGVDADVVAWLRSHRPRTRGMVLPAITGRDDVRGMWRHRAMFVRLDVDVVQFNLSTASSCQWAILAASTVPGLARVVIENSPMAVWSSTSACLKRLTSRRLAAHVAVGDRTARLIEESSGLPASSIETIYHGVPDVGRAEVQRSSEPTLLTVARHDPVKGVDVLLDAMALVPAPTRLVLIGDGDETDRLRRQRHDLGLDDRVELQPLPWERRASELMWAYDALVLPSRLEGFPVTIVEAMLAGLPVVATDVGSVREAVTDGRTGWVVPPEDPAALAAAIRRVVDDLPGARKMGAEARRIAIERFHIDATVDAYLQMYRRILGEDRFAGRS